MESVQVLKPCIRCGACERDNAGRCRACARAREIARYAANQERERARAKARRATISPELEKARISAWAKANPEAKAVHRQNRRARQMESGGTLSKGLPEKLFKLQMGRCACCKKPLGKSYHLDHILPLALGGSNSDENIQLLRARCNLEKRAKHPVDFMQSRGFLI